MTKDVFQSVRRDGRDALLALRELDDLNVRNRSGENLLHVAIAYSNDDAVLELIQRGIDVDAQDQAGMTPLHFAAAHSNTIAVQAILDHSGDFEVVDKHGNTPLWTAVFNAKGKYKIVEILIEHGAARVAHRKNKHERSPIDLATQFGDSALLQLISRDTSR